MGMFTTVTSPEYGDIQFKYGDDDCDRVAIGEPIPAGKYHPVPDGIYDGLAGDKSPFTMLWVVVKGGAVVEVVPDSGEDDGSEEWRAPSLPQAEELFQGPWRSGAVLRLLAFSVLLAGCGAAAPQVAGSWSYAWQDRADVTFHGTMVLGAGRRQRHGLADVPGGLPRLHRPGRHRLAVDGERNCDGG